MYGMGSNQHFRGGCIAVGARYTCTYRDLHTHESKSEYLSKKSGTLVIQTLQDMDQGPARHGGHQDPWYRLRGRNSLAMSLFSISN